MQIKCKLKRSVECCGVLIHPGKKINYRKLSMKNPVQRFALLALKEANIIDFDTDQKIEPQEMPVVVEKESKKDVKSVDKPARKVRKPRATNSSNG